MTVAAPARWQPPSGRCRWQPLQGGQSVSQSVVSGRKAAATVRAGTTRRATGRLPAERAAPPVRGRAAGPAPGTAAGRIRPVAQWQSCSNVGPKGGKAPPVEPYTSAHGLSRRHAACDRRRVTGAVRRRARSAAVRGRDFDLPRHSHYSGVIPMVFEHSAVAYTLHGVVRYPAIERVVERVPTDARRVACFAVPKAGCCT